MPRGKAMNKVCYVQAVSEAGAWTAINSAYSHPLARLPQRRGVGEEEGSVSLCERPDDTPSSGSIAVLGTH